MATVLLPEPEAPTRAMRLPGSSVREKCSISGGSSLLYPNDGKLSSLKSGAIRNPARKLLAADVWKRKSGGGNEVDTGYFRWQNNVDETNGGYGNIAGRHLLSAQALYLDGHVNSHRISNPEHPFGSGIFCNIEANKPYHRWNY